MIGLYLTIAIVGGTVHTGDGETLEEATVRLEDGRSTAVGKGTAPAGATVFDAKGKVVTPGLIESRSRLGLIEIEGVAATRDDNFGGPSPVRAAYRVRDSFNPYSMVLPIQRAGGVTSFVATPNGGLISGQAAAFAMHAHAEPIADPVGLVLNLGGNGGGARGAALHQLRTVLADARLLLKQGKAFERNQLRALSAHHLDLRALEPVLKGEVPLLVSVNRRADIEALLRLAAEEKLKIVLFGAAEAWLVAEALAKAKVPVVLRPSDNLPHNFDQLSARHDAVKILDEAGVEVAIATFSTHNARKLRQWAGNAVRSGLKPAQALKAITATPARILGLKDRGTIAVGKVADVVLWSGDPFELSTHAEQVLVEGRPSPGPHRQQLLFERYRQLPPSF